MRERLIVKLLLSTSHSSATISEIVGCSRSTVRRYRDYVVASGMSLERLEGTSDDDFRSIFDGRSSRRKYNELKEIYDFEKAVIELKKKGVNGRTLYEEYLDGAPKNHKVVAYRTFTREIERARKRLGPIMRQDHRAGEVLYVDFSGFRPYWIDRQTGEKHHMEMFVCCWGASSYTYAEVVDSQRTENFVMAHARAFEFFGGTPTFVVPDNLKAAIIKRTKRQITINPNYLDLASHYSFYIRPARPRRPKDKGKVEVAVKIVTAALVRSLRRNTCYSRDELSAAVRKVIDDINDSEIKRRPGINRRYLFSQTDALSMRELPPFPYIFKETKVGIQVGPDYHFLLNGAAYSVPNSLLGEKVDVRTSEGKVEVLHRGTVVAEHEVVAPGQKSTDARHMTENHRAWHDARDEMTAWAAEYGGATLAVARINADADFGSDARRKIALSYRRLCRIDPSRFEKACAKALELADPSYRTIQLLLSTGLETAPVGKLAEAEGEGKSHTNVRGSEYYKKWN